MVNHAFADGFNRGLNEKVELLTGRAIFFQLQVLQDRQLNEQREYQDEPRDAATPVEGLLHLV